MQTKAISRPAQSRKLQSYFGAGTILITKYQNTLKINYQIRYENQKKIYFYLSNG